MHLVRILSEQDAARREPKSNEAHKPGGGGRGHIGFSAMTRQKLTAILNLTFDNRCFYSVITVCI